MKHSKQIRAVALVAAFAVMFFAIVPATLAYIMTATEPLVNVFISETTTEGETTAPPTPPGPGPGPGPIFPPVTTEPETTAPPAPGTTYGKLDIGAEIEHPFGDDYEIPEDLVFEVEVDLGDGMIGSEVVIDGERIPVGEDGKITVTVTPGENLRIEKIPDGTEVTVTLLNGEDSGFTLDDGSSSKELVIDSSNPNRVDFLNVYTPGGFNLGDFVSLEGLKVIQGRDWKDGDTFTFRLEIKNADGTWKEVGTSTIVYDAENPDFDAFSFTSILNSLRLDAMGVYSFRLTEVKGSVSDVAYDTTVSHIDAVVGDADMDGKLELQHLVLPENAEFVFDEETGRYDLKVVFSNTYVAPNDIIVVLGAEANLKTEEEDFAHIFEELEFVLENEANGTQIIEVTDENGKAIFELGFSAADIGKSYDYTLSQVKGDLKGVEYSDQSYRVRITIGVDENNRLVAFVSVDGEPLDEDTMKFVFTFETGYDPASYAWLWFFLILITDKVAALTVALIIRRRYEKKVLGL